MSVLLSLSGLSYAFIVLIVLSAIIALYLVGHLLRSYPLVIAGTIAAVAIGVFSLVENMYSLGISWIAYSITATIFAFFYFYKNRKGAFWWPLGSLLALLAAAIPFMELFSVEESVANLLGILVPVIVFLVFGVLGGIIVPRVQYKDKNERKHLTNVDPIIGQKVKIVADKEGEFPARAVLGDVDWSVEPFFVNETFKVGDIVKVKEIKGVTLKVVRDGKDLRSEMKEKREAERQARKEQKKAKPAPVEEVKVVEIKEEEKVEEVKPAEIVPEPAPVAEPTPVAEPAPAPAKEKAEFVPFAKRMKAASPELKAAYNELKSEVLSYGIKSRVSSTGDTFRLHTKTYVKMVIAGKTLKLYLALNPKDYKDSTIPYEDASKMSAHKETPFVFKIKSSLGVRRAKSLIGDAAKKDGLVQGEVVAHNHAKEVK